MENSLRMARIEKFAEVMNSEQKDVIFKNYAESVESGDEEQAARLARKYRDCLLAECDFWDNVSYRERHPEQVEEWDEYRNALRDLPESEGFPMAINWPVKPGDEQ